MFPQSLKLSSLNAVLHAFPLLPQIKFHTLLQAIRLPACKVIKLLRLTLITFLKKLPRWLEPYNVNHDLHYKLHSVVPWLKQICWT